MLTKKRKPSPTFLMESRVARLLQEAGFPHRYSKQPEKSPECHWEEVELHQKVKKR